MLYLPLLFWWANQGVEKLSHWFKVTYQVHPRAGTQTWAVLPLNYKLWCHWKMNILINTIFTTQFQPSFWLNDKVAKMFSNIYAIVWNPGRHWPTLVSSVVGVAQFQSKLLPTNRKQSRKADKIKEYYLILLSSIFFKYSSLFRTPRIISFSWSNKNDRLMNSEFLDMVFQQ